MFITFAISVSRNSIVIRFKIIVSSHGDTLIGSWIILVPGPISAIIALSAEVTAGVPAFNFICDCGVVVTFSHCAYVVVWAHTFIT